MRKYLLFIFLCLLMLDSLVLGVSAEDMPQQYSSFISGLDGDIAEYLPDGIYSSDAEEVGEAVAEMSGAQYILSFIGKVTSLGLSEALVLLSSLVGVLVISAVFSAFRSSLRSEALSRAVGFCSSCAIFALIVGVFQKHIADVVHFFEQLSSLMVGIIPITAVLYAMGGNVTTATASSAVMYTFLAICEKLCAETVLPVASLLVSLAMCSAICPTLNLRGLSGAIKKSYTFILGFVMTVLLAVLSSQTLLSTSADTLAARAAKLVASTVIPVVGGSVGETLRTVSSSVGYLKSVCGISSIIFIIILLLPTLISILLTRVAFLVSGAVADMLGCEAESKLIGELGGIYGMLAAVCSVVSVIFIMALGIFVRCAVAAG